MAQSNDRDAFNFGEQASDPGNVTAGITVIDPTDSTIGPGDGSRTEDSGPAEPPKRRRGRQPGKKAAASVHLDVKGLEALFLSLHAMLAALTKVPELSINQSEAAALAQALANVQRHYPEFTATQKTLDWIALLMVVSMVYGTRGAALSMKKKAQNAAARSAGPGPWTPFVVPDAGA